MGIDNLPKDKKIVLFDGVCNYCNDKINFIIKNDKKDVFRFVTLQSETGQKIIKYLGIDNPESFFVPEKCIQSAQKLMHLRTEKSKKWQETFIHNF